METKINTFDLHQGLVEQRSMIANGSKSDHPQKYFIKIFCDVLYYIGICNVWYEHRNLTSTQKFFYKIYSLLVHAYLFGNYINELLAFRRTNLNEKEKNDLIQFMVGHMMLLSKIVMLHIFRKPIRVLLKRFFEEKREFAIKEVDMDSVKKAKRYCATLIGVLSITLFAALVDGVRMYFTEGVPIRTEVVIYPQPKHSGVIVNILRFFVELHWWYIVTAMASIDCICTCCLVFTGFKFRTLRVRFKTLRQKYLKDREKNLEVLEEKYRRDFESCIHYHKEILWCAEHVQSALGSLYSLQIFESIALLVICLIKLVTVEITITVLIASFTYITSVVLFTGAYMLSAGDIIYEAEQIPTAIFHSGWELMKISKKLRHLIIPTLISCQVPVHMTAFGIVILSYSNFVTVLRISYSFFAVMY